MSCSLFAVLLITGHGAGIVLDDSPDSCIKQICAGKPINSLARIRKSDTRFYDYQTIVKSLLSFAAAAGHDSSRYPRDSLLAPNTYDIAQVIQ